MARAENSRRLTPVQEGMVFHHLTAGQHTGVDIEQLVIELSHEVDVAKLRKAMQLLVGNRSMLRSFVDLESKLPQRLVATDVDFALAEEDWSDIAGNESEIEGRFADMLAEDRRNGIDISSAPLFRIQIIKLAEKRYRCVWTFHHLLMDGRSFALALTDLFDIYDGLTKSESSLLSPDSRYDEYLDWLVAQDSSESLSYWKDLVGDITSTSTIRSAVSGSSSRDESALRHELTESFDEKDSDRLRNWAREHDLTLNALLQAALAILQFRHTGDRSIVIGQTRAGRASTVESAAEMLGVFITTTPVRIDIDKQSVLDIVKEVRRQHVAVRKHEHVSLVDIQSQSGIGPGQALFDCLVVFDRQTLDDTMRQLRPDWTDRKFWFFERTPYPFTIYGFEQPRFSFTLAFDGDRLTQSEAQNVVGQLRTIILGIVENHDQLPGALQILTESESEMVSEAFNATEKDVSDELVHDLISRNATDHADTTSLISGADKWTCKQLDERSSQIARLIRELGVGKGDIVAVNLERSTEMVAAVLGVMKSGAAYLPLDPEYPASRIAFCLRDSGAKLLLTAGTGAVDATFSRENVIRLDTDDRLESMSVKQPEVDVSIEDPAYVIYTSGSTGTPKGVIVSHGNLANFIAGMDDVIPIGKRKTWLAVTSLSFDISILELLWTLARGFTVVLAGGRDASVAASNNMGFSLFYFASDPGGAGREKYKMVLDGAKFADAHGFDAIWTPERHFHAFGGLYPNPSVIGAAVAAITSNIGIRAGSVVLPLHNCLRVVEEWSLVDNLCNGRVGLSIASGWQPNDFVLAPDRYERRKEDMFGDIETVRRLWRGESVELENPRGDSVPISTYPRPVQQELPIWLTAAGSVETFRKAGEIGANLLTHLLGQTLEEIEEKIAVYRQARQEAGHSANGGRVTLMLHTFVGADNEEVREIVREPMKSYLRSAASLVAQYADAWTAYKQSSGNRETEAKEFDQLTDAEMDSLLDFAFERYFETSALFGTPEKCADLVEKAQRIGVDEIACLIDFGVDADLTLQHLNDLNTVKLVSERRASARDVNVSDLILEHDVSHMQCTPSGARSVLEEEHHAAALAKLDVMLVGGEAFPADLMTALKKVTNGCLVNMYGPTETTIWSTTYTVDAASSKPLIGKPIANTKCYVLDSDRNLVPVGVPGELYIGGSGVALGYHNRPELESERFLDVPFRPGSGKFYRTGDVVRWTEDGNLDFLGRIDDPVKIRGFPVELGEIETRFAEY